MPVCARHTHTGSHVYTRARLPIGLIGFRVRGWRGPARAGVNLRKCVTPSQNRVTEHATAALVHAIQSDRKYYTEKDTLRVVFFVRHKKLYALKHSAFRKSELFLSVR